MALLNKVAGAPPGRLIVPLISPKPSESALEAEETLLRDEETDEVELTELLTEDIEEILFVVDVCDDKDEAELTELLTEDIEEILFVVDVCDDKDETELFVPDVIDDTEAEEPLVTETLEELERVEAELPVLVSDEEEPELAGAELTAAELVPPELELSPAGVFAQPAKKTRIQSVKNADFCNQDNSLKIFIKASLNIYKT